MANLDFQNSIKNSVLEMNPDIKEDALSKKFMEGSLEEACQPENIHKANQQNIASITIENFKCIGDAVTIPIRPITLLFGKNSSGKSTVLQALRYHEYIWQIGAPMVMHKFAGTNMSGGFKIHFDDFPSLVHRHDLDRKIRIRIEYANALANALDKDDTQNHIYQWKEVITCWKKGDPPYKASFIFGFSVNGEELLRIYDNKEEIPDDTVGGSQGEKLIRFNKKEEDFLGKIYVNANTNHKALTDYCLDMLRNSHNLQFENDFVTRSIDPYIRHLGPFREVPETPDDSWEKGVGAWIALADDPELLKKTNRYMRDILKLGYTINDITIDIQEKSNITLGVNSKIMKNFKKICNSKNIKFDELKKQVYDPLVRLSRQPVIQLHVHDENMDIEVGLSDIGVGIAQIIPVVVGALDDNHSPGIFAVEQPELHVHPAVQVALGDVFIDSRKSSGYSTVEEFLDQSPSMQEARDKFHSMVENSKEELLDSIKNINDPNPNIKSILDEIIDLIKDSNPFDIEEVLDKIIDLIKDSDPLDVLFKYLSEIKEKYNRNIQGATQGAIKEFAKKFIKEFLSNIKNSNRTMLIETHSEHLLLRLLRRVRETNVRKEKKYEWRQSSMPPLHREMSEAAIRDAENQDSKGSSINAGRSVNSLCFANIRRG